MGTWGFPVMVGAGWGLARQLTTLGGVDRLFEKKQSGARRMGRTALADMIGYAPARSAARADNFGYSCSRLRPLTHTTGLSVCRRLRASVQPTSDTDIRSQGRPRTNRLETLTRNRSGSILVGEGDLRASLSGQEGGHGNDRAWIRPSLD